MPSGTQFARTSDGFTIAYSRAGRTDAGSPPLIFARGWMTHLELSLADDAFRTYIEALQEHMEVVRYDGRGNGLSDRDLGERVALEHLVADLEAVVDAVGATPVVLWGSSFAGPAAVTFTAHHPERVSALILDGTYASGSRLAPPEQREKFISMLELARVQPDGVYAALSFLTDPDPGAGHDTRVARIRRSVDPEAVIALYSALYEFEVEDLLPSISVPTLVLHRRGTRSIPFDRGRELAAAIPGARFVSLDGRAHNPWEENPRESLAAIGDFLGLGSELADRRTQVRPPPEPEGALPLAILFTDIVGSTELTGRLGDDDAHELVRSHNAIVRGALAETRGTEVKHTGDGIMASFPAVSSAVACAARIQQAIARHNDDAPEQPLHVKIGINAGEPLSEDDDLYGTVVQLSARVCDQAGPDEVVVTNIVREIVAGKGLAFRERGEVALKGFPEPVRLWQLDWSA